MGAIRDGRLKTFIYILRYFMYYVIKMIANGRAYPYSHETELSA